MKVDSRRRVAGPALLAIGLLTAGCGDDGDAPTGPPPGGGASMKATIDGVDWVASPNGVQVTGDTIPTAQGMLTITGVDTSSGISVSLLVSYISGPGTVPLGVNTGTNAGGTGMVGEAPSSWTTPLSGAAGTVTITARSSTRVAGTFQFDASPVVGVGADVAVTAGEFDITIDAGLPPLPTGSPSRMTATLDTIAWNGATIVAIAGGASFGGSTTSYAITFLAKVPFAAGGTYDIGSEFGAAVTRIGTTDSWVVTVEDSVGYVTLETVDEERISGSFAGTLPPFDTATTPLALANGTFSVHVPPPPSGSVGVE
jgi:hypothetical protein